jgi:glutamate-ammonia-ligase adenylyltransferase
MLTLDMILSENRATSSVEAYVRHAAECSPFLTRLLKQDAVLLHDLLANLQQAYQLTEMQSFLAQQNIFDEAALKRALRVLRRHVLARMIVRDLNGLADLYEIMRTTSTLAEVAVQTAIHYLSEWLSVRHGQPMSVDNRSASPEPQALIVVGMGKLGGVELNVSSDIDLIFSYEEDGETNGEQSISNQEFFTKLAKKLIAAIDEITEDGFVFRVDMRLRPFGSEGSLVSSLDALENYYQHHGREWERYAWIKGRVIAGNNQKISTLLKPFVYRKYLDFGALASMRDLKMQIQRDVNRRDLHDNIKLGRGGIREIEFIAQVFQLMRGGQDPSLQVRSTLQVLSMLAEKGLMRGEHAAALSAAYVFLRNLEHRLQYYNDAQTHDLPQTPAHRAVIANAMRMPDWAALEAVIAQHRNLVSQQFGAIFAYEQSPIQQNSRLVDLWTGAFNQAQMIFELEALDFENATEAARQIETLRLSHRVKHLPDMSRQRLDIVMPVVIELCAKHYNSNEALQRMIVLIETVCRRASYLAFFAEYPKVLERVVTLLSASPWLASYLTQHPILLDSLTDVTSYAEMDVGAQETQLMHKMQLLVGDTEQQMNTLREFQQTRLFSLASEDVIQHIPLPKLAGLLSDLADMILRVVMKTIWPTVKGKHLDVPKFSIIAYGKHGSRELGYSSDLDLVFLYDDEHPDARDIYSRFGQRIIAWLNTMTSAGILYEIDMQLRPDGGSGLLVSSIEGFKQYQFEKAWVWEHQAITRARFAAGDVNIGKAFEEIRTEVLCLPRDLKKLRLDIVEMRRRMKDAHRHVTERFDLKHSLGGMIDVEFIVQYLILAYAHNHPQLLENKGNIQTLRVCAVIGLIPSELGQQAADAYHQFRRQQHALRLQGYVDAWVPEMTVQNQLTVVRALWRVVLIENNDN